MRLLDFLAFSIPPPPLLPPTILATLTLYSMLLDDYSRQNCDKHAFFRGSFISHLENYEL